MSQHNTQLQVSNSEATTLSSNMCPPQCLVHNWQNNSEQFLKRHTGRSVTICDGGLYEPRTRGAVELGKIPSLPENVAQKNVVPAVPGRIHLNSRLNHWELKQALFTVGCYRDNPGETCCGLEWSLQ